MNWRPVFDAHEMHRELEIIKDDLHCNAVRIHGTADQAARYSGGRRRASGAPVDPPSGGA
jgi:hypothetical protein